jgi:hypothetical protein
MLIPDFMLSEFAMLLAENSSTESGVAIARAELS